jgi:hypothetical protein
MYQCLRKMGLRCTYNCAPQIPCPADVSQIICGTFSVRERTNDIKENGDDKSKGGYTCKFDLYVRGRSNERKE